MVPLTIPNTFSIGIAPRLSWTTRITGIAPATAASKRSWAPPSLAAATSSSPCWATSCLLAVTTWRPSRRARVTYSRAGSMPPISSTITSLAARISSKSPCLRPSTPVTFGRRPATSSTISARSVSSSLKAPPTVPLPRIPT